MEQLFAGGGALQVPFGADFFSVAVGVLTGAIFACDRKLDIVGTIVLGLVTAYGGGIIRDLLLQDHGVYFMEYPEVILICICLAVFVFYFRGLFRHTGQVLFFADALSVALFALAGANKAFACGEGFVMVVILGALTSVGGGALRDISVETPGVFQRSNSTRWPDSAARSCSRPWLSQGTACAGGGSLRVHRGVSALPVGVLRLEDFRRGRPHAEGGPWRANGQALLRRAVSPRHPASQEGARYPRLVVSPSKGLAYATAHSHRVHGGHHRHDRGSLHRRARALQLRSSDEERAEDRASRL
ncbi:MAG: trimeric intracellular cation channel family protein [Adlercreutzia equolifaciens]